MKKKNQFITLPRFEAIAPIFHSDATGKPLKNCVMCDALIHPKGGPYMIEKAFRYNMKFDIRDTIFEYAICMACYDKISTSLSPESGQTMIDYFNSHVDLLQRSIDLLNKKTPALNDWIGACVIKGTEMKDCAEFQVCCQCDGDKMLFNHLPIMLSEEALQEMNDLLSESTKEELDDFRDKFIGVPPEWRELMKSRSPVLI